MYGLSADVDLSFLVGRELHQVCIGRHQAILYFPDPTAGDVSISIETDIGHKSKIGELTALYKTIIPAAPTLVSLMNCIIVKAFAAPPGTLVLVFSNDEVLEVYDTSLEYESYQISYGGKVIVV